MRPPLAQGGAPGDPASAPHLNPLVVLTYDHAGAELLQDILSRRQDLACTSGTGLVPLCEQAAASWREIEGRHNGVPSALAAASIRTMTASMATVLRARTSKQRWCEFSVAAPAAAATFLHVYPGARIVCLHRSCAAVIRAALDASPWGLSGPAFAPFVTAYPASTVAALAAYWAAHTEALLELEKDFPQATYRIRYEDLTVGGPAVNDLLTFMGLRPNPASGPVIAAPAATLTAVPDQAVPADLFSAPLLQGINEIQARLGYPPLR